MRFAIYRHLTVLFLILTLLPASISISAADPVETLLARMSLEDRVGQVLVVHFWGTDANTSFEQLLDAVHPGGVVLLKQNLDTPHQIAQMTENLQRMATGRNANIPLLIMLDQEGGKIQRLREGFTYLPQAFALGAITDRAALVAQGRLVGAEMRAVGVNMDLAPVVDLAYQPNHPTLAGRMMGDDPARVHDAAIAITEGMSSAGVIGVLKHFPGHGDATDTHVDRATVDHDLAQLERRDLAPFVDTSAPAIMLGHISAPALDPSGLPATLSAVMIAYLRGTGHFEGLIMTDAMDMGAITRYYTPEQAAVKTIQAGADLVLLGANVSNTTQIAAYRAVLDAVRSGEITAARLDDAVRHVLQAKQAHGLLTWTPQASEEAESRITAADASAVLGRTYAAALTVVRNEGGLLPLRSSQRVGIVAPSLYAADITAACKAQTDAAFERLPVSFSPLVYERSQAVALAGRVDVVLVFTQDADQNLAQQNLVRALPAERTVVVVLQSPFDLRTFPDVAGYLIAYDPVEPAFRAACGVLFGKQTSRGVLPVRLTDEYPSGWGLVIKP